MGYGDMGSIMLWWYVAPPYRVAEDVNTPFACLTDTQSVASARCKWTRAFCVPRYYIFPSTLSHSLLCVSFFHRELFSIHHFLLDRFPLRIVGASLSLSLWHLQFPGTYVFFYSLPLSSLWFTRQLALLCGEYASSFRLQTNLKDVGKENQIDGEMATIKKSGLTFAIVYDVTSLYVRVLREHSHLASRSVYMCLLSCLMSWVVVVVRSQRQEGGRKTILRKNGLRVSRVMDEIVYLHRAHLARAW